MNALSTLFSCFSSLAARNCSRNGGLSLCGLGPGFVCDPFTSNTAYFALMLAIHFAHTPCTPPMQGQPARRPSQLSGATLELTVPSLSCLTVLVSFFLASCGCAMTHHDAAVVCLAIAAFGCREIWFWAWPGRNFSLPSCIMHQWPKPSLICRSESAPTLNTPVQPVRSHVCNVPCLPARQFW